MIVAGVTAAGCVRHIVEGAIAEGFRPIIDCEAVGDRVPGVVEWNLSTSRPSSATSSSSRTAWST